MSTIRERHEESKGPPDGHVCLGCWELWPCDAVKALAAGEALAEAGRHWSLCESRLFGPPAKCDCGWDAALANWREVAG